MKRIALFCVISAALITGACSPPGPTACLELAEPRQGTLSVRGPEFSTGTDTTITPTINGTWYCTPNAQSLPCSKRNGANDTSRILVQVPEGSIVTGAVFSPSATTPFDVDVTQNGKRVLLLGIVDPTATLKIRVIQWDATNMTGTFSVDGASCASGVFGAVKAVSIQAVDPL